ncbi:hypothetical protein DL768_007335 [Monosporascus sp. mg162]|nr:hypothetical protein DL768_007335 [Monosporascus sp. mg162]
MFVRTLEEPDGEWKRLLATVSSNGQCNGEHELMQQDVPIRGEDTIPSEQYHGAAALAAASPDFAFDRMISGNRGQCRTVRQGGMIGLAWVALKRRGALQQYSLGARVFIQTLHPHFLPNLIPAHLLSRRWRCTLPRQSSPMAQTRSVHLVQVHPSDENAETDVDIIAIHGLDTKSPDTWTWKSEIPGESDVNWLKDPHMLPSKVGHARIFTCDWPADLIQESASIPMRLTEFARILLSGIHSWRAHMATNGQAREDRPIVFIASCLGGIILMEALVIANHPQSDYISIRRSTHGIVFLATPFRGTAFRDIAYWAVPMLKARALLRDKEVTTLLSVVEGSTFNLENRVNEFTDLCQDKHHPCEVLTFYERGETVLLRRLCRFSIFLYSTVLLVLFLAWLQVSLSTWLFVLFSTWQLASFYEAKPLVDKVSATLDIARDPLPLARPHVTMNKFRGPEDGDYKHVAGKLEGILRKIRDHQSPLKQADAWIRDKHYTVDRLKIERLSGDLLPMDQCYINLAIVEQADKDAGRSEEGSGGSQGGDRAPQSSPFSLLARLKIETPDKEIKVELPTIFDPRKGPKGRATRPRRILVRGRAGVGKATLCKKIVHEFRNGKWCDLFDRVLWVPLRKLKGRPADRCNLGDLFCDEYFRDNPDGQSLAKILWRTVSNTDSDRTLFILDGLDEVSREWNRGEVGYNFLLELLNQPDVIITSRPNANLPASLHPLDLELETIGFYPDQVNEYLEKTFKDTERLKEVQLFLRDHGLIRGLVRIPIQLDAVCFTWDKGFHSRVKLDTMTKLYKAIEQRLWKKDILRLEKKDSEGALMTEHDIEGLRLSNIEDFVEDEIYLLEALAFTGLYNDVIDFDSGHWNIIAEKLKRSGRKLPDKELACLSFLRTSDTSSKEDDRNYHFIHLTFQEYFAARYFVRQWKGQEKTFERLVPKRQENANTDLPADPVEFLQKHKYTAHYDIFWRFVAGLLDTEGDKETVRFFETIEDEPRDLLGPTHQRLVMHCLCEVSTDMRLRKKLEQILTHWLFFELAQLKGGDPDVGRSALAVLRGQSDQSTVSTAFKAFLRDLGDENSASSTAFKAFLRDFGDENSASSTAFKAFLGGLSDENSASSTAFEAFLRGLGDENSASSTALKAFFENLRDENSAGSTAFKDILENLGGENSAASTVFKAIFENLADENSTTLSKIIVEIAENQGGEYSAVITCPHLLGNEDSMLRLEAAVYFKSQSVLSPEILETIALLLECERASELAETILRRHTKFYSTLLNGRYVKPLYKILLRRSFKEQWSWYIDNDNGEPISCVNMPDGFRKAHIDNEQEFRDMIDKARPVDSGIRDASSGNALEVEPLD